MFDPRSPGPRFPSALHPNVSINKGDLLQRRPSRAAATAPANVNEPAIINTKKDWVYNRAMVMEITIKQTPYEMYAACIVLVMPGVMKLFHEN